jgi:hypothetical protein
VDESAKAILPTMLVSNDGLYAVDEVADHIISAANIPIWEIND